MQTAETVLDVLRDRGRKGAPVVRLYRQLYNRNLFLLAYGNIHSKSGAMTPGATDETVDGMSLAKIDKIIAQLRRETYRWTPVRRAYIPKKSGKLRPLGVPTWSDKLLQEVIHLLLDAYYDPQFSDHSHGFRTKRGCHTALRDIVVNFKGKAWFIEGDVEGCFDNIDHQILLDVLAKAIHDNRFLRLIRNLLRAGYLEDWKYGATLSGTPQGGVVSPLLSNIYLHQLDKFVEEQLIPRYTRGKYRRENPEYARLRGRIERLEAKGNLEEAKIIRQIRNTIPSRDNRDPNFRRLRYVRYADDFILGFAGPKSEAIVIKRLLKEFLGSIKLELSETKTLITHAMTEKARFLGYDLRIMSSKDRRSVYGHVWLGVPRDAIHDKMRRYMRKGKPHHRAELLDDSAFSIVAQYAAEYRGFANYYLMAHNICTVSKAKWVMEQSLVKTLAAKLQISALQVVKRLRSTEIVGGKTYRVLQIVVPRKDKQPLKATWGGVPLIRKPIVVLNDTPYRVWNRRTEILERLLADTCELCGSTENVQVHHIRALKDLTKFKGQNKPEWVEVMAARRRKTLVVCRSCHWSIHNGTFQPTP